MNRKSLRALFYVGLCLALCLTGVQLAMAAGARDRPAPAPTGDDAKLVAHAHDAPQIDPGATVPQAGVRLVAAFDDRIVLAASAGDITITTVELPDGSTCQEILLPGYQSIAGPGHPALPTAGVALGIPTAAVPSVRIVDSEFTELPGVFNLCPEPSPILGVDTAGDLPTQIVGWQRTRHPDVYNTDALMPADPVEIANTGFIRDQRIAEITLYPLQYNPTSGGIRLFTRMTVELQLNVDRPGSTSSRSASPQAADRPFDALLRSYLLNYDQARMWRQTPSRRILGEVPTGAVLGATATGTPVYRLEVREAGLYALSYADLQAVDSSVDLSHVDPRTFHLSTHGQEVAIEVTGQEDGVFDPGDTLYFFAEAINTVYANLNVYWLTWDEIPGIRMATLDAVPTGSAPVPANFTTTIHLEEDHVYKRQLVTADGDNWFWSDLQSAGKPVSQAHAFTVPNLATVSTSAIITGDLLGYSANPHHAGALYLNGHRIYSATWPSQTEHLFAVSVPQTYLVNGTNVLSVTAGIGNAADYVVVNRFALTYSAAYSAIDDQLWFEGDHTGTWEFRVGGFTTDTIKILDITDSKMPSQIAGGAAQVNGLTYTLPFSQSLDGERRYLAVAAAQARSPISISRDVLSDLYDAGNAADYVVIAHGSLITPAHTLADYRATRGLRTQVVNVQDVYDEFNFGIPDIAAIRDFLAFAYANWTAPAPAYVVLFGDGHSDPKDNLGLGKPSLIPPYLDAVDPWIRETAADNRYVTIDGDDLPDMFIGRLPANTLEQANVLVDKIIGYEQPSTAGTWQEKLLFVADNADTAGDFAEDSNTIADHYVPAPYTVDKVYLGVTHNAVRARAAITTAINEGHLIVNYTGHGAPQLWAAEKLLSFDSIPYLNNVDKLPFFVPMTCLEGYYISPSPPGSDLSALAETLVRLPTGGAIASWSATGLGLASGHDYLDRGLFEAIFYKDITELGPATTYAKLFLATNTLWFRDLLDTYTLFGDPATQLMVLPVDLQITKEVLGDQTGFTSGERITYTLTYTNTGPTTAHNVAISDTVSAALSSLTWTSGGTPITIQVGSAYVWEAGDMAAGAHGTITVSGIIPSIFEGPLTNAARITTTSREDETLNNNSQIIVQVAQITTDLKLTSLTVEGDPVLRPEDVVTYTLTYMNTGPDIARDVVLTDTLPALVTQAAWVASGTPITLRVGTPFAWDIADLPPGARGTVTITGIISRSLYAGPLANIATISTASVDTEIANNTASVMIMISPNRIYLPIVVRANR